MSDRELLELAAKAAGVVVVRSRLDDPACKDMLIEDSPRNLFDRLGPWNPITDDGDALRLAVRLRMEIDHNHPADETMWVSVRAANQRFSEVEEFDGEAQREAALRRAIVRAAAEIGRATK